MDIIKDSRRIHSYDVFLGGSCNPTTWRKDLAIPYLREAGVSFYNPQVDHWSEELIDIEHVAKENAVILFFVIDSQTRNVVTNIETVHFAGSRTIMILVVHPLDEGVGLEVAGEQVSHKELLEIKEAHDLLHRIFSRQGIMVFDNVFRALDETVQILKNETQQNHCNRREKCTMDGKIRVAFDTFDADECGKNDVFDLCDIIIPKLTDIYIIGEHGDEIQWREDIIAISTIEKSNLSYRIKSIAKTDFSELLNAHTLLFVISNKSRSLATMILAAYCISKNCKMVLCVQNLNEDNYTVHGEKLTKTAVNDYNRGRAYLADLASREGVPVHHSLKKAIETAIRKSL